MLRRHNYELSAVVAPNPQIAAVAYDTAILTATLDWMLVAANDYYGSDSRRTAYLLPTSSDDSYNIENLVSNNNQLAFKFLCFKTISKKSMAKIIG